MPDVYYFDIYEDPFCKAVRLYAANPYDTNAREGLLDVTNALTVQGLSNLAKDTRDTRLLYLTKVFWYAGILEEHIALLKHFLKHSQMLCDKAHQHQPLLTQLFAPDTYGTSAYNMTRLSHTPKFSYLLLDVCEDLVKRNILKLNQETSTYTNYFLDTHLRLLSWEYQQNRITKATYLSAHTQLLAQPQVLERLLIWSNKEQFCMLNKLLSPGRNPYDFQRVLHLLNNAYQQGWISLETYRGCLLEHRNPSYTLLHQLVFRGEKVENAELDATNFKAYLDTIDTLRGQDILSHNDYLRLFTQENKYGYSVIHQALNAPNLKIARTFMAWFDNNSYLSVEDKKMLLHYKSTSKEAKGGAKRPPGRRDKSDMKSVNAWLKAHKIELHETPANPKISERGRHNFYPLEVEIPENTVSSLTWTPTSFTPKNLSPDKFVTSDNSAFSPGGTR
ncbi:MAG: hypothetical protein P1U32_07560 [Legionellaceae bacterium]|nr:hypothetical protein [Legionellaceae bacterium]